MSMSKKDFNAIAAAFKEARLAMHIGKSAVLVIEDLQIAMANVCKKHNANFDYRRFGDACSLDKVDEKD